MKIHSKKFFSSFIQKLLLISVVSVGMSAANCSANIQGRCGATMYSPKQDTQIQFKWENLRKNVLTGYNYDYTNKPALKKKFLKVIKVVGGVIIEWLWEYYYHFHADFYLGVETFNDCLVLIKMIINLLIALLKSKLNVLSEYVENPSLLEDYLKQRLFKVLFHVKLVFKDEKKNPEEYLSWNWPCCSLTWRCYPG